MAGVTSAVSSQDYDALLFGAPCLYRRAQGGKATYVEIRAADVLRNLHLTHEQLVDVAILAGTDFHPSISGLGSKLALKLIQQYGTIDGLPGEVKNHYAFSTLRPAKIEEVGGLFLAPDVCADVPTPLWRAPSRESLVRLCCREHHLNEQRVSQAIERWAKALKRAPNVVQGRIF